MEICNSVYSTVKSAASAVGEFFNYLASQISNLAKSIFGCQKEKPAPAPVAEKKVEDLTKKDEPETNKVTETARRSSRLASKTPVKYTK